jgi:hypothetical protein
MAVPRNIKTRVIKAGRIERLVITIDLTKRFGESTSGKSMIIASTGGGIQIPDYPNPKIRLNVSLYEKA